MTNDRGHDNRTARLENSGHLSLETLSAYSDNQLPAAELAAATVHLASCTICQEELRSLQVTSTLLRNLAEPQTKKTFQLGPEYATVSQGGKVGWIDRLLRGMPALRTATAAVAMLLVVVIAGDVLTNRDNNGSSETFPPSAVQSTGTVARSGEAPTSTEVASSLFQAQATEGETVAPTEVPPSAAQQKVPVTASEPASNSAADAAAESTDMTKSNEIQAAGAAAPQEGPASFTPPSPIATSTATALPTATPAPTTTPEPSATPT